VTQFLARKYGAAACLALLPGNRAQPAAASGKAGNSHHREPPHAPINRLQYASGIEGWSRRDRFDRARAHRDRPPLVNGHPYFKPTSHVRGHG